MACETGSGPGDVIKGFFDFLGDPIGTILEVIANKVLAGAIAVFGDLTTGIPTLVSDGTANKVNQQTQWLVVYTAVGSLLFAAARMALERRGEAGTAALKGLLRVILVVEAARPPSSPPWRASPTGTPTTSSPPAPSSSSPPSDAAAATASPPCCCWSSRSSC